MRSGNAKWTRSQDYRYQFFRTHKMPKGGYRCPYCGRKMTDKKMVEIDHIIPVYLTSRSFMARMWMRRKGFSGVNDPKNLVASCHNCNRFKGKKGGLWIWRGFMGQKKYYWPTIYVIRSILAAVLLLLVCIYGVPAITKLWNMFA